MFMSRRALGALASAAVLGALVCFPVSSASAASASTARIGRSCPKVNATAVAADGTALVCVKANTGARRWTARVLPPVVPVTTPAPAPAAPQPTGNPSDCVTNAAPGADLFPDKVVLEKSSAWTITYEKTYKVLTVTDPWRGATTKPTYVLVQCGTKAPALDGALKGATVIEIPVKRIALLGTTPAAMTGVLGVADRVVTVDDPNNYSTPALVSRIKAGNVKASGYAGSANLEVLLAAKPDLVWANGSGSSFDGLDRMRAAGLPVAVLADTQEKSPLGRAEWVKALAAFTNTEAIATKEFGAWSTAYAKVQANAAKTNGRPGVIAGSMFQGTWYMPGGQSFVAQMIKDAGGSFAWSTDSSAGSLALDFETVIEKGYDAQYWINAGFAWSTLRDARAEDSRYARLVPFQAANAFANDVRVNATGGNDFFESAVIRPDLVLADLFAILHPEANPNHTFTYYRRLPKA
jgi:iron complex transport system substrate-binding protein